MSLTLRVLVSDCGDSGCRSNHELNPLGIEMHVTGRRWVVQEPCSPQRPTRMIVRLLLY